MQLEPIKERARGRWQGILPAIGVSSSYLSGKHGPCPMCGGKDRFRWDNKNGEGTYFCSNCGAGDGVKLVMETQRVDFKNAVARINEHIGSAPIVHTRPGLSKAQQRESLRALYKQSQPVTEGDPVWRYLRNRGCGVPVIEHIRYVPKCLYTDKDKGSTWHPAMLAVICDVDGTPVSLHRTYLTMGGQKADVESVRRLMPGSIAAGSSVRLTEASETLGIAEGIETALSASKLFSVPCWAALNTSLLRQWQPPAETKTVVIFADNDANFAGQKAAYDLASNLANKHKVSVSVKAPDTVGWDWNDVLNQRVAA